VRKFIIALGVIIIIFVGFLGRRFFNQSPLAPESGVKQAKLDLSGETSFFTVVAENLEVPWGLVFLPDKSLLVTERTGRLRLIDSNGRLQSEPVAVLEKVREIGEGGLLGITLHPDFSNNNFVYLYYTYQENEGETLNRVVRMTYQGKQLGDEKTIIDGIPGASNHNGGRIKFGPDGYLYVTTGDTGNSSLAQDINSLAGKILRVTDQGQMVADNPFGNLVYSYGHRNPQGLTWDNLGRLWATEHGRSGVLSGFDELNLIEKGKNYGWPEIQGDEKKEGMETPKLHSGSTTTWAPSGLAFVNNSLFFGGLRGQTLYEAVIEGEKLTLKEHFKGQFGRLREVVLGPDGYLYVSTSNKDGRGNPVSPDDRIIKINSQNL
jgi:glucose/arabinose dehydrogenase